MSPIGRPETRLLYGGVLQQVTFVNGTCICNMQLRIHAGDRLLAQMVNWMIATPPIYEPMKFFAKQAMKSSAVKSGLDWDAHVRRLQQTKEVSAKRSTHTTVASSQPRSCCTACRKGRPNTEHLQGTCHVVQVHLS